MRPYLKKKSQKMAGGVIQVVEHLPPSKCEALSSNLSAIKKKEKKKKKEERKINVRQNFI
jgi:hypothetical protein